MADEPWRTLPVVDRANTNYLQVFAPPEMTYGEKTQFVRDHWADFQEARKKNLKRDYAFMEAYEIEPGVFHVVNYRSFKQYLVSMNDLSCDCPDQFYTFADEGSNIICKHALFVAFNIRGELKEILDGPTET